MKWIEARIVFDAPDTGLAVELISNIFYELGLSGVVVEDPTMDSTEDWADTPLERPDHHAVIGYIPADERIQDCCRRLESELSRLEEQTGIGWEVVYDETAEEDWAESWKQFFKPQKITDRLVVKPTWKAYTPAAGEIILKIDPGMAFGTGTHPTTSLCLELIEKYLKPNDTFLDIGTGSGILMIAAAKLGASKLTGIDTDPMAVSVARSNLALNDIHTDRFSVETGDLARRIDTQFQMVVSNILSEVILRLLDDLKAVLSQKGMFIFSGITRQNLNEVLDKIETSGFQAIEISTREEWAAVAGSYKDYSISNSFESNQ
jgi:ribosomal protein L11 methyltransferase